MKTFLALLTIAFIVLKFTNTITWSWWWVLGPMWVAAIIVLIGGIVLLIKK